MPPEFDCPFELIEPAVQSGPLLFCSPHSGDVYPQSFLRTSRLSLHELRRSADLFVDELVGDAARFGVPLLRAHFPRSFVDANREPYELDPQMFAGRLPVFTNTKSARVSAGYGTIARLVGDQQPIYSAKLPADEALRRVDRYYLPFHACLRRMVACTHAAFASSVLVDWHSMPSAVFSQYNKADIVLGDRHGTSCDPDFVNQVADLFCSVGFSVHRNQPYAGGFITEHYGKPRSGRHALQIEINRALYMDEKAQEPNTGFSAVREAVAFVTESLVSFEIARWQHAAE